MDRTTSHPVDLDDAKKRLRTVASERDLASWVRRHPGEGVLTGFLVGLFVGSEPKAQQALKDFAVLLLKLH